MTVRANDRCVSVCSEAFEMIHIFLLSTDNMFNFTCFNIEDPNDPSVGLINGELSVPGNLLRREVFDPVVNQVRLLLSLLHDGVFSRP